MRNSNVKIFTAFTYLLLLLLILGSVAFLIIQKVEITARAEAEALQVVERIQSSYMENNSFTSKSFSNDVKDVMQNFSDLIKVITITDGNNLMQNRFRFDSIDPNYDSNPQWQSQLEYQYNPLLYDQKSFNLRSPGTAHVQILFQRLPISLIKNVLQFDTLVILALLILSFLAFLVIPKRDPAETTWALQSVADEDELYDEEEVPDATWGTENLPETTWDTDDDNDDGGKNSAVIVDDDLDPAFGEDNYSNSDDIAIDHSDPWADSVEDPSSSGSQGNDEIDLNFNETIANMDDDAPYLLNDEMSEEPVNQPDPLGTNHYLADKTGLETADPLGTEGPPDETEELDFLLAKAMQDMAKSDPESEDLPLKGLPASSPPELGEGSEEIETLLESEDLGDTLVDDLDEGLGDDEPEFFDRALDADIFPQISVPPTPQGTDDTSEEISSEPMDESTDEATDYAPLTTTSGAIDIELASTDGEPAPEDVEELLDTTPAPYFLNQESRENVLSWLGNFLDDLKSAPGETNGITPDLSVALVQAPEEDIATIHSSIEQDLNLQASILPQKNGMAVVLPSENIQSGIKHLQDAVSRLPAVYLQDLRMGITGISSARSDIDAETVLTEMQYALENSDNENNISIFDANDQVFNQQRSNI